MRPAPFRVLSLPPPLLSLLALLAAVLALACGCSGEPPATCGQIGRAVSCACPGGAMGAQECGPVGVWGACVCPGTDAGADGGGDAGADAAPDALALDTPADAVQPDAPVEASVDAGPDAAPDAPRDVASEFADTRPDRADAAPDADPLLEHVSAVRVTAEGGGVRWTAARAQSCTVTAGAASVGAEFDAPEAAAFSATAPEGGGAVLFVGTASDVRAEARRGAPYTIGGTSRVNLSVRGTVRGTVFEVTALGCAVR